MRIAALANFVGPRSGGIKVTLDALGRGYADRGVERLLVVPGPRDDVVDGPGGRVVQVRAPRFGDVYRLIVAPWRVAEILENFRPNTIELHDKTTLLPVARWARSRGIGVLLFSHERLMDMFAMRTQREWSAQASIAMLNRVLVRSVDSIVVTSRFAATEFQRPSRAVDVSIVRVPLGVDLDTFRPPASSVPDEGLLRLVLVGRLSREKSPHLAVETVAVLHRRGVPVRLDVYGSGPHEAELRALADSAEVRFHGHLDNRNELAARIGAADIALSVCPSETFGLAALEALACGTPVVTASTGGASEIIDGTCGGRAQPDPAALADAVLRVAARDRPAQRLAARARAATFTWDATIDAMLRQHHRLLATADIAG